MKLNRLSERTVEIGSPTHTKSLKPKRFELSYKQQHMQQHRKKQKKKKKKNPKNSSFGRGRGKAVWRVRSTRRRVGVEWGSS
jgi:hypothetical protein